MASGHEENGMFEAFLEHMPIRFRDEDGPDWFHDDQERKNWPRFLRHVVEDVAQVVKEDQPSYWDRLARDGSVYCWSRALTGAVIDHLRGSLASWSVATDPMRLGRRRERVRRICELIACLDGPPTDWPDWLNLGEEDDPIEIPTAGWSEPARAWLRQLAGFDARAFPSYTLRFPVVDTDDRKKVHIIDSVVTLCPRQAPGELTDTVDVRPAPWSSLVCEPSVFQELPTALGSLLESDPVRFHFLSGHALLLELRPAQVKKATELLPPSWKSIEGDSLGLAVVLACWASHRKPLFRHLILTGAVEGGRIKSVGSVTEKFQGACKYADDLEHECFFLVPEASQEARRLPSLTPRILVEPIPTWDEFFALIPRLLTDGFDGYRHRVATTPGRGRASRSMTTLRMNSAPGDPPIKSRSRT